MFNSAGKIWKGMAARAWPQVDGVITSVTNKVTKDSDGDSRELLVRYSYEVGGESFEGRTLHPAYVKSSMETTHEGFEKILGPGTRVRVYYRQGAPGDSTLSTGFYSGTLPLLFGGLIFFGAGVGFLGAFWFILAGNHRLADGIQVLP